MSYTEIDVWGWVVRKINACTPLVNLLGDMEEHFLMEYPNTITVFPMLVGHEINNITVEWHDDMPFAVDSEIEFDVFVMNDSYKAICAALSELLIGDLWQRTYSANVPDLKDGSAHRNMRFVRRVTSDDLSI